MNPKNIEQPLQCPCDPEIRQIVNASWDAIIIHHDGVLLQANDQYFELFGYAPDELTGKPVISRTIFPDSIDYVMGKKELKKSTPHESIGIRKDGTRFPIEIRIKKIECLGKVVNVLAIKDITQKKLAIEEKAKLEQQLQHAQKMKAIGTLAGGIAHDFNNILAAIMGFVEMAQLDVALGSPTRHKLDQVLKATYRAKDLVKQILTFSREAEYEKKPVKINLVIKEVLKLLRASLPSTIEIRQDIASNAGAVLAAPTQIHQILMNLCTNAYHAMIDHGGILEVRLENAELDEVEARSYPNLKAGIYLKLTVSDTGHGIDPNILDRIFEPYFTTKEKEFGTGMGLSVVHGIVKNHEGAISVESDPGRGTRFHVLFPRIQSEVKPDMPPFESLPTGNETILFVDDEEILAGLGKQMLERLGYTVVTRTSSIEALEAFRAQPEKFNLVITDLTMPNMTGNLLAKELVKIRPDIPIILCTGFGNPMFDDKLTAKEIREILFKPMALSEIAKTIRKVLDDGSCLDGVERFAVDTQIPLPGLL